MTIVNDKTDHDAIIYIQIEIQKQCWQVKGYKVYGLALQLAAMQSEHWAYIFHKVTFNMTSNNLKPDTARLT